MAGANLQIVVQAKDQASSVIAGISKPLAGLVSGLGAIGLASIGLDSIGGAVKDFIGNAMEAQAVQSQLNAVLKSTHGVAGMTADSVNDLANSLSKVTPFEDEAIGGAENLLLTFTNVGKNVFPEATGAILDMSQALGQDLQSSTIQLGKALNDPIKGITALSRVGVSFTEGQKKMIEQLVKAGKTEQAQKVILKELATEFGGAAKAAGQTFTGKMAILETQIGNVKEAIGGPLITALSDLMTKVTPLISDFADGLPGALSKAGHAFQGIEDAVKDLVGGQGIDTAFADFNDLFVEAFDISPQQALANLLDFGAGVVDWAKDAASKIAVQLLAWGKAFVDWISPMIPPLLAKLNVLAGQAWAWIQSQVPIVLAKMAAWKDAFIAWISPMIPPFLAKLGELATQARTWIVSQVPVVEAKILAWKDAFIAWIGPMIPPFLAEIGKLATSLWQWIQDQAAPLIAKLGVWKDQFVAWIPGAVKDFLAAWPAQFNKFLDWIGAQALPILTKLGEWGLAFINWIAPKIPGIVEALAGISIAIVVFILETAGTMVIKLAEWGLAFIKWVAPQIPKLLKELEALDKALTKWMNDELDILGNLAYDWGRAVVSRFLAGFHSMSLADVVNLAAPTPGSPISNLLNPPAAAPSAGSRLGYNDVHVHIYGNQSNPSGVSKAATDGVVAAQRSMGY